MLLRGEVRRNAPSPSGPWPLKAQHVPNLRFKNLASAAGVRNAYGPETDPEASSLIRQRAASYLQKYPDIASLLVAPGGADAFDYGRERLVVNRADPDILAHEAEHAHAIAGDSFYKKLLAISRKASDIGNVAAGPAVFGLLPLLEDVDQRRSILKALAGINTAVALPNLLEEAKASTRVVADSDDKWRSIKTLAPAFAAHALHDLYGTGVYLGGLSLLPENKSD